MLPTYDDIKRRIKTPPLWYDRCGVPRYAKFHPRHCGIYNRFVALTEVACQNCDKRFRVAIEREIMDRVNPAGMPSKDNSWMWHYGDPPRHDECLSGNTMNTIEIRVLQFWRLDEKTHDWVREKRYEIEYERRDETV